MTINFYAAGSKWAEGSENIDSDVAWENWLESRYDLKMPERGSDEWIAAAEEFGEGFLDGLVPDSTLTDETPDGIEMAEKSLITLQGKPNISIITSEVGFILEMFGNIATHYVQGGEDKSTYEKMKGIALAAIAVIDSL